MKHIITIAIAVAIFVCACTKHSVLITHSIPATGTLIGSWNIVSDSTYAGVGIDNHPVDYQGQPGDYFNVNANGNIYIKEGAVIKTLTYSQLTDTSVIITSFGLIANGVPETSAITNLTSNSAIIAAPLAFTPGGIFGRKITLAR